MSKKQNENINVEEQEINEVVDELDTPIVEEVKEEIPETTPIIKYTVNNCKKLNVRKKPDITSNVVCIVDKTNELTIEEIKNNKDWVKVCTDSGKKGFCMKKYVAVK